jgi:hypothetical protein
LGTSALDDEFANKFNFVLGFFGLGQLENLKEAIDGMEKPAESGNNKNSEPVRPVFVSAVFVSTYKLTSKQRNIMVNILVLYCMSILTI